MYGQLGNTNKQWNKCCLIILAKSHHISSPGTLRKYSLYPTFWSSGPRSSKTDEGLGLIFHTWKLDITTINLSLYMLVYVVWGGCESRCNYVYPIIENVPKMGKFLFLHYKVERNYYSYFIMVISGITLVFFLFPVDLSKGPGCKNKSEKIFLLEKSILLTPTGLPIFP